jgi:hypothetical protein
MRTLSKAANTHTNNFFFFSHSYMYSHPKPEKGLLIFNKKHVDVVGIVR